MERRICELVLMHDLRMIERFDTHARIPVRSSFCAIDIPWSSARLRTSFIRNHARSVRAPYNSRSNRTSAPNARAAITDIRMARSHGRPRPRVPK